VPFTEEENKIYLLYFNILLHNLDFYLISAYESPLFVKLIFELSKVISL